MPLNLIKKYNDLLILDHLTTKQREKSLFSVFKRDFIDKTNIFRNKNVNPTSIEGEDTMETFFNHLITTKEKKTKTNSRDYDKHRAERLHWISYHLADKVKEVDVFSVNDKEGIHTYIFNKKEAYVIVLEPKKEGFYYLLSAYYLRGGSTKKITNKKKRKLERIY